MSKNQSSELPVLMIAFTKGENVNPVGLPTLRFYVNKDEYLLLEGEELIKAALIETVKGGKEPSIIALSFAVEVLPMSERPRRRKGGQV